MSHTKVGWYEECVAHPRPATTAPQAVWDAWNDAHFTIGSTHDGNAAFTTCEPNRLADICAECTIDLQAAEESDEVYVPWPCPAPAVAG